ncbi:MAG: redoxin domain-containing protein [Acidobacteria bacterium]|nr:redoxin domain-containing protein [Acidobacteriota bacterium]
MQKYFFLAGAMLFCCAAVHNAHAEARRVTLIYDEKATEVEAATMNAKDLWITKKDLAAATRFVVKPQGVCRDELCFPLPKARKAQFLNKQGKVEWFNLSEFARLIKQPTAFDDKHSIYYFGPRLDAQNAHLNSLEAPNFTLPDLNGKPHSLADFRGKKVLLITWASW